MDMNHRSSCLITAIVLLAVCLITPAMAATTQVQIVKYANDDTTILDQTTVNYTWMEANLPVLGDGTTHYYHQGPVFVDDANETLEQELRWNPEEDTNVQEKDMGAVKGTNLKDLCDLVGGMSPGEEVKLLASDGWFKWFAYENVYEYSSREGPIGICWYKNGQYPDSGYTEGMRMVWFADTSVNSWGIHAFGNYDWHEAAAEEYWYYYISGGEYYPTTTGLSGQVINRIYIYSDEDPPVAPTAAFTADVTSGDAPLTVQFTDASTGTPTSWAWDFENDGTVDDTNQSPSHIYDIAGTYTVNLTVTNAAGSDSEVKADYITVTEPVLPVLNVNTGVRYATIQAAVTAATAGDEVLVSDGSYTESVVIDKSLTIRSENGSATTIVTAATSTVAPFDVNSADFVTIDGFTVRGPTSNVGGIDFTDSDSGTITNNDVAGCYNGIHLGGTSTNNTVSENYCHGNTRRGISVRNSANGNFIVRNILESNAEAGICIKDTAASNIVWLNDLIGNGLDIGTANTENSPNPITYTYGGGTYTSYLGNYYSALYAGTDADGNGVGDPSFTSGSYWADDYPLMAQSTNYVETKLTAPVADFIADVTSGTVPLTVQFTDQSTGDSITDWAWDFENDGTVDDTNQSPSHIYDTAGTYTVNHTVTNAGGSDSEVKMDYITVTAVGPKTWYVHTSQELLQALADASDGDTVFLYNGIYDEVNNYMFSVSVPNLTITGESGEGVIIRANSEILRVGLRGNAVAGYTATPAPNCLIENITMTVKTPGQSPWGISVDGNSPGCVIRNIVSDGLAYYPIHIEAEDCRISDCIFQNTTGGTNIVINAGNITFENNVVSNSSGFFELPVSGSKILGNTFIDNTGYMGIWNPASSPNGIISENTFIRNGFGVDPSSLFYFYDAGSDWKIYLNNFVDNVDTVIFIDGTPPATISWNSTEPIPYTYNGNSSTGYLGNYWGSDYTGMDADGDGVGDTPYDIPGSATDKDYHPLMGAWDNGEITYTPPAVIAPVADFTADVTSGDAPLTVQFTDLSTGDGITDWAWDFENDGTVDSTDQSPSHTYTTAGTYTVNLTVTNAGGSDDEVKADYITVTAGGTTWYVDDDGGADFTTIQGAVNAAADGDTIIVKDGTYTEIVEIEKSLTIQSENGRATTLVHAAEPEFDIFSISADNVVIDGFTIDGATESFYSGIYLYGTPGDKITGCVIKNNDISNNDIGFYPANANDNIFENNIATGCTYGLYLDTASNNQFIGNTFSLNEYGVDLCDTSSNVFYLNNFVDNSVSHVGLDTPPFGEIWNSQTPVSYLYNSVTYTGNAGNYWSGYSGADADGNGIGDTPYTPMSPDADNYPLMGEWQDGVITVSTQPPTADFIADVTSGTVPLTVQFTDLSTGDGITDWAWDFENDGTVDSTDQSPSHTYTTAGTYTVNLTVTNAGGSDDEVKTDYITVTPPGPVDLLYDGPVTLNPGTFDFVAYNTGTKYQIDSLTPHGALDAASKIAGFDYNATDKKWASMGTMLLDDVAEYNYNNTVTPKLCWAYQVNGVKKNDFSSTEGISAYRVNNSDVVEFYYGEEADTIENATAVIRTVVNIREQDVIFDDDVTLLPGTFNFTAYNSGLEYQINTITPHGALDAASNLGGFVYNATDKKWGTMGTMLLDDVGEYHYDGEASPKLCWAYAVNGVVKNDYSSTEGISVYELQNNDRVEYFYGDQGDTLENATAVVRIRVHVSSTDNWTLQLIGAQDITVDRQLFEEGVACIHSANYTDLSGTWEGMPLWDLVGYVDDELSHGAGAFNDTLAAEGYQVKVTASDGFNVTFNSSDIARNNNYIIANTLDGQPLLEQHWPLKLVGSEIPPSESVAKITTIELVGVEPFVPLASVHIIKYGADGVTIVNETNVTVEWMEQNLDVIGDGVTPYRFQGITNDPTDLWDTSETLGLSPPKIENAVKGTRVKDLCDLVGGMGTGTDIKFIASDGYETTLGYSNIYTNPFVQESQGDAILAWYADGDYVPDYGEGIRLFFTPEDHVFGQWDMHECMEEQYWHYYYQAYPSGDPYYPGVMYPSCAGLSAKFVATIEIYSEPTADWTLQLDGTDLGGLNQTISRVYFEQALACQFGANHETQFTDSSSRTWGGMPLWFLCGFVDDADQHSSNAYNDALAQAGYNITITASDGYNYTFNSQDTIRNTNYIVANTINGTPIPEEDSSWPLRLVGQNVSGAMVVKKIASIKLVPSSQTTISVIPATVRFPVNTTQEVQLMTNNFPQGLAGFDLVVTLVDPGPVQIVNVTYPAWAIISNTTALPSSSVRIGAVDLNKTVQNGALNVPLATLTLRGNASGTTQIALSAVTMDADGGGLITPSLLQGQVEVYSAITADFTANRTSGMASENVTFAVGFTDLSTGDPVPSVWQWQFGNGAGSALQDPVCSYTAPGRYSVTLNVSNAYTSANLTRADYINVTPYVEAFPWYTNPPTTTGMTGDYLIYDINGNNRLDFDDVVAYYQNMQWIRDNTNVGTLPYDYNKNGRIDFDDVVLLYDMVLAT